MPDSVARPPQPGHRKHIAALDGLRGLAVLLVFLLHYGGGAQSHNIVVHTLGVAVSVGWCGVTLFFLLSGFLITGILMDCLDGPHWTRNFYARRVLRIFPLYYATIGVLILAGAWQGALRATLKTAIIFACFCQNVPLFPVPAHVAAPVFHLASVAVEEQFYLLWPLLFFLAGSRRRASLICIGAFVASFCFRAFAFRYASDPILYMGTLFARAGELAIGCLLALLYGGPHWNRVRQAAPYCCAAFLAAFLLTSARNRGFQLQTSIEWLYGLPAITLCFAALLAMAVTPGWVQRLASASWLCWLGRISYGIYVFHVLLVHFVNLAAFRLTGAHAGNAFEAVRFVVAAAATLVLASLSFRFFERPFLSLKRSFPLRGPGGLKQRAEGPVIVC